MPEHTWIHGYKGKFGYQPLAGPDATPSGSVVIWDMEEFGFDHMVDTDDITHSGADGAKVVLDGIESATGDVRFVYDPTLEPSQSPQVFRPRKYAYLTLKPDGATPYAFAALITKIGWRSGPKAGAVRCTASFESCGPIVTPPVTP